MLNLYILIEIIMMLSLEYIKLCYLNYRGAMMLKSIAQYIKIYNKTIYYFKNKYPEKILDVDLSKLSNQKERGS